VYTRIDYNKLNDAIFMQIRLVIIAQLSVEVVGGNVEIWWGVGCFNISCLVLYNKSAKQKASIIINIIS